MPEAQVVLEIVRDQTQAQTKCTFYGGKNHSVEKCIKRIRKEKEKGRTDGVLYNRQTKHTPQKCFRCLSEYHLIVKFPNPDHKNEKRRKEVCFNKKGNCEHDNDKNNSGQNIYASMARISDNDEFPSGKFSDSLQQTSCNLYFLEQRAT